jgi:hypothetical protein
MWMWRVWSKQVRLIITAVWVTALLLTLALLAGVGAAVIPTFWSSRSSSSVVPSSNGGVLKSTGQSKEFFAPHDTIVGDGLEFTVQDFTQESENIGEVVIIYCAAVFTVKNVSSSDRTVLRSDFVLEDGVGNEVFALYPSLDNPFTTSTTPAEVKLLDNETVKPGEEIKRFVGFECTSNQAPYILKFNTGSGSERQEGIKIQVALNW